MLITLCLIPVAADAQGSLVGEGLSSLKGMTIEELLEAPVTSASRRPQKYADAAAAIFVISREDIHRSGAASIPELLRMVPGVQVAQIDASKWAISARGFNARYSSKLLVQMDGRTLYSPLYSGVYWDSQDTVLEDIERIEVIRGPGATLWGANAVNGIINIVTRSAHDTQGGLVVLGAGTEETASGSARYGWRGGESSAARIYVKGFERDASRAADGEAAADDWRSGRFGFRSDLDLTLGDSLTVQGDYYEGNAGATITRGLSALETDADFSGGNLLMRWSRQQGLDRGLQVKVYYDHTRRVSWTMDEARDTVDIDLQQYASVADRHVLLWGGGYRVTRDDIDVGIGSAVELTPSSRSDAVLNAFIQDDISLYRDDLHLILGSKIERNDYSGWELQPSMRGLWSVSPQTNVWAAISRAVRISSRFESDVTIDAGRIVVNGNTELSSERLNAYELGMRTQPQRNLSLDLAAFVNDYDRLVSYRESDDGRGWSLDNVASAHSYGIELAGDWKATPIWRLKLAYSWLEMDLDSQAPDPAVAAISIGDSAPRHQLSLRSWLDLGERVELDTTVHYVDSLEYLDADAYVRLDVRLAWHPGQDIELSLIGKNLLDPRHSEFSKLGASSEVEGLVFTQVERSLMLQAKWTF